jgi:hypothetical protein
MRFDRYPRAEGYRWTSRMETLHMRRHERAAEKIAHAYPLFADQLAAPAALSVDEEKERRERMFERSEQRMRDLIARQWRDARREYFACPVEVREQITAEWKCWRGPANTVCFSYVIEKHNGVAEEKSRVFRERERAMNARIDAVRSAQSSLSLC